MMHQIERLVTLTWELNTLCDSMLDTTPSDVVGESGIERIDQLLEQRQLILNELSQLHPEERAILKQPELVELDKVVQGKMTSIFGMIQTNVQMIRSKKRVSQAYRPAPDHHGSYIDSRN